MPNVSHDLEPRYSHDVNAKIIGFNVDTVSSKGWATAGRKYGGHLVAWVPLRDGGQLRTTSYNQNRKRRVQSFVQKDGGVNIGTEEWSGERVLLLVLDERVEDA